jgi:small multidrug resistance pump
MLYWVYLIAAISLEILGTTCMKLSAGFTRLTPTLLMFGFYVGCFSCLTLALKRIEVSVAYAIWSGVGTAMISLIGILLFQESFSGLKLLGIALIIGGVVALNLAGGH